jgi:hypothetical protein
MTLTEANTIWEACYGDDLNSDGWSRYTAAQRAEAIAIRNGAPAFYDAEAERIDRRRAERDGWKTAHWDGRW